MAKSVSVATRAKISRALKGNKNAFQGGSKPRLSTRQKIANINAAAKAKKANLSSDQIARRQAVAKRLRAQARREEALGGGVPDVIKTNEQLKAETLSSGAQQRVGSLESVKQQAAKTARESNQRRQADRAKQVGREASMPRSAKQNLNAPQKPEESRRVDLSPAQNRRRQRSKFEADQAKARQASLGKGKSQFEKFEAEQKTLHEPLKSGDRAGARQARAEQDMRIRNAQTRQQAAEDAAFRASQRGSDNIVAPGTRQRGKKDPIQRDVRGNIVQRSGGKATTADLLKAYATKKDKPQPPQSDTGSDRSGTFTKKVPVKGQKATRPTGRKAIETEEDLDDFKANVVIPGLVKRLSKDVPSDVLEKFRKEAIEDTVAKFRKEGGGDATDAIEFLFKEFG
jgi:hypothetical protein